MTKKGYIDNEEFKTHLIRYGELTNDVSEWWRNINPEKKANNEVSKMKKSKRDYSPADIDASFERVFKERTEFRDRRERIWKERLERIEIEKSFPEKRESRELELERVKNEVAKRFLLIARNYIKRPNFINYDYFRKETMVSDSCMFMYNYIERFNTDLKNPLAYYTQVANSAFIQHINTSNKNSDMFTPISFVENLGEGEHTMVDGE